MPGIGRLGGRVATSKTTTAADFREIAAEIAAAAPRLSTGRVEQLRQLLR